MFEEALKKSARDHADKDKNKHSSRDLQCSLRDESDSGDGDLDVAQHFEGEKVIISDFGGPSDDFKDEDFSEKVADEESESSSEEVEVIGSKRKTSADVNQHRLQVFTNPLPSLHGKTLMLTLLSPKRGENHGIRKWLIR